jgi:predicted ATPase
VSAASPEPGTRNSELEQADSVRLFVERARLYRPEFDLTPQNAGAVAEVCRRLDGIPLAIELAAARVRALSVEQIAVRLEDRLRLLTGGSRTALPRHQTLRAALEWSHDLLTAEEQALLRRLSVFAGGFELEAAEAVCSDLPPDPVAWTWGTLRFAPGQARAVPQPLPDGGFAPDTPDGKGSLTGACPPTQPSEQRVREAGRDRESGTPSLQGGGRGVGPDVLDLLTSLVDKSLVIAEEQGGIVRYRLLETVRQYAGEKLDQSGESTATRDRHLDWYLALAQSAAGAYRGPHEPAWLTRLEQEHDNLRAALAWSLAGVPGRSPDRRGLGDRSDPRSSGGTGGTGGAAPDRRGLGDRTGPPIQGETALRLAGSLATFWDARGHLHEGQRWLAQALAAGAAAPVEVRAQALLGAGVLAGMIGDSAAARALHEESLRLYRRLEDRQGIASAQANLGKITYGHGDLPAARALFEASLALYRELGHKPGIADDLGMLALIAFRQGDNDTARTLSEARLAICRELGNQDGVADTLELLATVAGEQGDDERPVALLEESLALYRELGNRGGIALALGSLGMAAWTQGDYDRASSLLQESLTLYRQVGDSRGIARLLSYQGMIALYQRDYARAEGLSHEGLVLHQAMGDAWSIGRYLSVLAGAAFGQGQPERAARLFAAASTLRERLGTPLPALIRVHHDRAVAAVRRTLGDDAFAAAWHAGETIAVDAALDDVQPSAVSK